jgi:hypothetical protein
MSLLYSRKQGARPNRADDIEAGVFLRDWEIGGRLPALPNGLSYSMADELGFPRRKRGEHGRAGQSVPARTPKRADDPSRGVVGREALDVAHYITDMTAQLEAMAIAAHLDLLAYFLGMAKAESEIFVRTNAIAEVERADGESSYEPAVGLHHENNSFD